jgi:NAD(P)-dependent dehydrogenase (short-subunit alcohol dehydrogenase family)
MENLQGKTAFVTGGASGIGLGMAHAFAEAGMKVAIADVREDHLASAQAQLTGVGKFHFIHLDVTDRPRFAAAADEAEAQLGPVSVLCNNAGVGVLGGAKSSRYPDWDWTLSVNIGGVVNGIQTFLPRLLERGEGHIVNTSSIGAMVPMGGGTAYLTSKAAIVGLSEALYSELYEDGIGVTLLIPGPTATNIHEVARLRPAQFADTGLQEMEEQLAKAPLFEGGMAPIETGRMVVDAIKAKRLYLFTHGEFRTGVEQRLAAIMTGFIPGTENWEAAETYGFPLHNQLFADMVAEHEARQK